MISCVIPSVFLDSSHHLLLSLHPQVCGNLVSTRAFVDASLVAGSGAAHMSPRVTLGANRPANGPLLSLASLRRKILPDLSQLAG